MGAPPFCTSCIDVVREGLGELDRDAELRRAKRVARSSEALAGKAESEIEDCIELCNDASKLTKDFLRAFRRARSASS